MYRTNILVITVLLLFVYSSLFAQSTQWRGQNRNGKYEDVNLQKKWPENGPEKILILDNIGKGWSSAIFSNNAIYVTGMIDTLDYLTCADINGNINFQVPYGRSWPNSYPDTRSTPTIDDNKVYLVSGVGELVCINALNGEIIWKVNVDSVYQAVWSRFGVSESPLIVDDKVLCSPGGELTSMVAFDKYSGKEIWKTQCVGGKRIYASPELYSYNDLRFILGMTNENIFAVEPETGKIIWKFLYMHKEDDPEKRSAPFTNTPIYKGNELFISCGYDYHCTMLQMSEDGLSVSEKWTDTIFDNHHHGMIEYNGYIFGSNYENNKKGKWVCMEWETGKIMYEHKWETKGEIIFADDLLYIVEEKSGTIALLKPDPEKFEIISSFKLEEGEGPYWAHPTIFDGKLFLRHGTSVVVYNIRN